MNPASVEDRLCLWARAKGLPTAHVRRWLAIEEPGRTRLLEIAESLKMRAGQCITALSLLEEIAVRERQSIGEILNRPSLRRIASSPGSGPGRARAMLDELRSLRYPRLRRVAAQLAEELAAIKLPPAIKVVLPRDLASDEIRVEIVARGSTEMAHMLECLTAKTSELVRLAAMLSGVDIGSEFD
jgi:hypothetical protein